MTADTAFILIVEDEDPHDEAMAEGLRRRGHACHVVTSGPEAVDSVKDHPPHVVVTGYKLGGTMNGMDVLREVKRLSPTTEVVLITAHGSGQLAREALRPDQACRAFDYLEKPFELEEVWKGVGRAARQAVASRENQTMREQSKRAFEFEGLLGTSEEMRRLIKRVKLVADSKITVLIIGESGTGKDLIAQAIHLNSPRKSKSYRVINCAGFNENLLESELFGHVKGAFTGATMDRRGLFEAADGGTLFLDEVGDMPPTMQAKLLRVLENGEVFPVGSNDVRKADVRVIAATHQNLRDLVKAGKFREDLLYRLHQVTLQIPPLARRREDIPLLVAHFIANANKEQGKAVEGITPQARRKLVNYSWPGNVRELKNMIDGMVVLTEGKMLDVEDLPDEVQGSTEIVPVGKAALAGMSLQELERYAIEQALNATDGNREKAAKMLNIGARTLYRKLKEYGIK